ncbi:hypothetical protein ACFVGN_02530 [Streptomyces sp. NPDC057757]|uniref:hypothetical protein n=1 Tax=Streptomyces sp. NPDC057757 TaxID=3346241 RepID=UPI0036BB18D5
MAQPSPLPALTSLAPPVRPPGTDAPPTCEVPHFAPVRVRGGRYQLRRLTRHKRRAVAAGLAVTAAALIAAGPRDTERARGHPVGTARSAANSASAAGSGSTPVRGRRAAEMVSAPVRIADAATVRLLRPGDRVDVVAADGGGDAQVVASGVRVTEVPRVDADDTGALVVLSVPRDTAARLAGASTTSRLAVTLC